MNNDDAMLLWKIFPSITLTLIVWIFGLVLCTPEMYVWKIFPTAIIPSPKHVTSKGIC